MIDHAGKNGLDAAAYFMGHGLQNIRCLRGGIDALGYVFKGAIAAIVKQRVPHRVPAVGVGMFFSGDEPRIANHTLAGVGPHIRDIQIRPAIAIVVEP